MAHHGGKSFHSRPQKQDQKPNEEQLEDEEEEEDPYDVRIKKSGCSQFHYALQDCMDANKDWRKCQNELMDFKKCIQVQQKMKNKSE